MKIAFYDSNLTDAQWTFLEPMLPARKKLGRPDLIQTVRGVGYRILEEHASREA